MTVPTESVQRSRDRLNRLWTFELLRDGQPFFPELEELWNLRQNEVVLGMAESKIQQIELTISMVNPAASNAFLTLGQTLNALRGGRESEFLRRLQEAREEMEILDSILLEMQAIRESLLTTAE